MRVSHPGSLTVDLTTTLGILPPNELQWMPPVPPSVTTHSVGLLICLTNMSFYLPWAVPCRKQQSQRGP